ncbi:MAG: hypothetical protein EOP43_05780 [Sphingobacteriaceae bacterium]|nr:MAG: hypothetical protein EOP43_05780 [Sphingobacteriaceae bacterium]
MKKIFLNTNLYILLLLPIFLLAIAGVLFHTISFELPDMETEISGLFNRRTIFQVLCEVVKSQF